MIFNYGLIDIWREKNPNTYQYTWHSNSRPVIFSRLDYFLISNYLLNTLPKCQIKPGYKTDHSTVILSLDTSEQKRGPGYFKINNTILYNTDYQNQIKSTIRDTVMHNTNSNPNTLWEILKGAIRKTSTFTVK